MVIGCPCTSERLGILQYLQATSVEKTTEKTSPPYVSNSRQHTFYNLTQYVVEPLEKTTLTVETAENVTNYNNITELNGFCVRILIVI